MEIIKDILTTKTGSNVTARTQFLETNTEDMRTAVLETGLISRCYFSSTSQGRLTTGTPR